MKESKRFPRREISDLLREGEPVDPHFLDELRRVHKAGQQQRVDKLGRVSPDEGVLRQTVTGVNARETTPEQIRRAMRAGVSDTRDLADSVVSIPGDRKLQSRDK